MYNAKYESQGSRSSFYIIDKKRGFKTFIDKQSAERARSVQYDLAVYDLAPKVLSEVGRIRLSQKEKKLSDWGFITELAELLSCSGNECHCGECEIIEEEINDDICELCDKIESSCGFSFVDCHIGNIGYIKRNRKKILVCIDTGEESVQSDYEYYDDYEYTNNCSCTMCRKKC